MKMKKILALAVAAVMTLSTAVTAMAATTGFPTTGTWKASPKVEKLQSTTSSVTAYQFLDATYDNGKVSYTLQDWAAEALVGVQYNSAALVTKDANTGAYTYDIEQVIAALGGQYGIAGGQTTNPDDNDTQTATNTYLDKIATAAPNSGASVGTVNQPATLDANNEWTATFNSLDVGGYVVIANDSEKIYNPMQISVGCVADTTGKITGVAANDTVAKWSTIPFDKKQTSADMLADQSGNYGVGDTVSYEVTSTIPKYDLARFAAVNADPTFTISDAMSEGLTGPDASAITIEVKDDNGTFQTVNPGTGATDVTLTINQTNGVNSGFTIDFTNWVKAGNGIGKDVKITYSATINENAKTGFDPNTNTATLKYKPNPSSQDKEVEDKTYEYSFAVDGGIFGNWKKNGWELKKTGVGQYTKSQTDYIESENEALAGADFTIYRAAETGETPDATFGGVDVVEMAARTELKGANPYTTQADGRITFEGLDADTVYYITETNAPSGYSLNTEVVTVKFIVDNYDATTGQLKKYHVDVNGTTTLTYEADSATNPTAITVNGGTVDMTTDGSEIDVSKYTFDDTTEIHNTKLASLPSTGGMGTTLFTVAGCLIMIAAAGMFFVSRRKEER